MNTKNTIPLGFDPQVIKDSQTLMDRMQGSAKEAAKLRQDFKAVKDLIKSMSQANIIGSGPGSSGGGMEYLRGMVFLQNEQVKSVRLKGTAAMQNLMTEKKALALSRDSLRTFQNQNKLSMARSLHLKTDYEALKKIKSTTQLQIGLEATKVRLGLEVAAGNTKQVQKAQKIVGLYDRRIVQLKQETAEQKKLERLETRRAARLTASQRAQKARSETQERLFGDGGANLFGIQAGLGANYAIMNGIRSAMAGAGKFTAELDLAMRNLQAITVTTDGNMQGLRETLIGISEQTKFTAVEVANMAVTLGQAGLSTDEIVESSRAITLLATATGTDLTTAVGVATSVLGVFNLQGSEMARVANVMTEAVNGSKLSLDKLALGLQYSGNIAAQSGIRVEELTSALGAMANAGIRSGSTLGTGMRQILIALQKPSAEFQETLARLGITMSDIDVRSQGLYGALANLRDGGFSAGDAIQTMQVRAAAAYNALSSNLDQMVELETAFQGTTAAAQANETQMKAFSNQLLVLKSVAGSAAAEGLAPLLALSTEMITGFGNLLQSFRKYPGVLRTVTTSVVALGSAFAVWKLARLTRGLFSLITGLTATKGATKGLIATQVLQGAVTSALIMKLKVYSRWARISAASVGILGTAMRIALGPIGLVLLAVGTVVGAFSALRRSTREAATSLDSAQSAFDRSAGGVDSMAQSISSLDDRISELLSRYDRLSNDQKLLDSEIEGIKSQFISMGLDITSVGGTVDDLIETLRALRRELAEEYVAKVNLQGAQLAALQAETGLERRRQTGAFNASGDVNAVRQTEFPRLGRAQIPNPMSEVIAQTGYDPTLASEQTRIIGDENSSADQVAQAVAELSVIMTRFDENREELDPSLSTFGDNFFAKLVETVAQGQAISETAGTQRNQGREAIKIANDARDAQAETVPAVESITNGVGDLNVSTISRLQDAGAEAPENDAVARYEAMLAEADRIETEAGELEEIADSLLDQGIISADKHQRLMAGINTIAGNVAQQLGGLQEASDEVTDALAGAVTDSLETNADNAVEDVKGATTVAGATTNLRDAGDAFAELRNNQIDQARETIPDVQLLQLKMDEIDQEYAESITTLLETFTKNVKDITGTELEAETDALEVEFEAAKQGLDDATDRSEATRFADQAVELLEKVTANRVSLAEGNLESARVLELKLAEIRANATSTGTGIDETLNDTLAGFDAEELEAHTKALGTEFDVAKQGIGDATNRAEATVFFEQATALQDAIRLNRLQEADETKTTARLFVQRLADIRAESAAINNELSEILNGVITGFDAEELEGETRALETQVDVAVDGVRDALSRTEATVLFEKASELYEAIRLKGHEAAEADTTSAVLLAQRTEEVEAEFRANNKALADAFDESITTIDEAEVETELNDLQAQEDLARASYDRTYDLAQAATDLAEHNRLMALAHEKALILAGATLRTLGVEFKDSTPVVQAAKLAEAEVEANTRTDDLDQLEIRGPRTVRGSGSSDEKDPIEEWVGAATAQITAVNLGVAEAMFTPGEAVDKITGTVAEAQTKIEGITAQIEAMRSRVLSGTLTADEQERLNTLVEQHGRLSTFVLNQQKELVALKYEEGDIMGALRMQVQQFATENLDMGKTLMEGIGGALSSLTGSLKNFFKSWADGTKSGKEAFKDLALSVVSSIADMMAEMLAMYILQTALGFIMGTGPAASRGPSFAPPVRPVAAGGRVRGKAAGGRVDGNHPRDTQLHKLMDDEFVVRSSAARAIGFDNLEKMNAMGNNAVSQAPHRGVAAPKAAAKENAVTNIYLVDERSQAGGIGPDDIIAVINDDIARGGTTKKLIKSVSSGAM
jgi:TP901 family phage tail tape measure protein